MNTKNVENRRDESLVPVDALNKFSIGVVGVGAVGRQVALQLATMGATRVSLIDPDTVGIENVHVQGYKFDDIGQNKVDITFRDCISFFKRDSTGSFFPPFPQWDMAARRFQRSTDNTCDVIFSCVDSIDVRRLIFDSCGKSKNVKILIDGRAAGEVIRVIATPPAHEKYVATLFSADRAFHGSCTAKMTIYTANITAGLMVAQFTKWMRGVPSFGDCMLNLLGMEFTVADW